MEVKPTLKVMVLKLQLTQLLLHLSQLPAKLLKQGLPKHHQPNPSRRESKYSLRLCLQKFKAKWLYCLYFNQRALISILFILLSKVLLQNIANNPGQSRGSRLVYVFFSPIFEHHHSPTKGFDGFLTLQEKSLSLGIKFLRVQGNFLELRRQKFEGFF